MSEKTIIKNITSGQERAFYAAKNTIFENIIIDGKEDGESSFKECRNISILNSKFNLVANSDIFFSLNILLFIVISKTTFPFAAFIISSISLV